MPGFNGRGPMGGGPMTGGGRGYCNPAAAGYGTPFGYGRGMGYARGGGHGYGRGYGPGRGFGRGYGRGYTPYAPACAQDSADELTLLKRRSEDLQSAINAVNNRIAELQNAD